MDFAATREWLEKRIPVGSMAAFDLGGPVVSRDFANQLIIKNGADTYSMDRVPVEVFDNLSKSIEVYRALDSNTPIEQSPEYRALSTD